MTTTPPTTDSDEDAAEDEAEAAEPKDEHPGEGALTAERAEPFVEKEIG